MTCYCSTLFFSPYFTLEYKKRLFFLHGTTPLRCSDKNQNYLQYLTNVQIKRRNPVFNSWSTNSPPPYFSLFFLSYFRLSQGQACPAGLGKRFNQGPAGLEPPTGAIIRKIKNKKKWGGGGCLCSKSKTRDSPNKTDYIEYI